MSDTVDPTQKPAEKNADLTRALPGVAYLVGAGPGDPGLLTVRAATLLASADVVLYDALASEELLRGAPAGCELVYVGKRAARHAMTQREIGPHSKSFSTALRAAGRRSSGAWLRRSLRTHRLLVGEAYA